MKIAKTKKQEVASNLVVHGSMCSIVEKAILHVGVVNAYAKKKSISTIVGNIVSEHHLKHPTPYGGQ